MCCSNQDPSLLDGFPLYWVNKGKKESSFRKARGPEKMGALDKDLCNFWKGGASCNVVLPTSSIISYEFHESQLDVHIGLSLSFLNLHLCHATFVSCVILAFPMCCPSLFTFLCIVNHWTNHGPLCRHVAGKE